MATMASASTNNSNLLSNGINRPNALIAKLRATTIKVAPNSGRKVNWRIKIAKSPNVQLTRNAQPAGKRTTPLNGAGKGQGHTYVPKGRTRMIKPMTLLEKKRHQRSQVPQRQTLLANQILSKLIQNSSFATTPNT